MAPLQAGDSFILTAGSTIDIGGGCRQRSSDGATPIFLSEIATGCQPRVGELALGCTFETDQCTGWMQLGLRTHIPQGVQVVEGGEVLIDWFANGCYDGCREIYAVRIERLPPNTEMNGSR